MSVLLTHLFTICMSLLSASSLDNSMILECYLFNLMMGCENSVKNETAAFPLQHGSTSGLWRILGPFSALLPSIGPNDLYEGIFEILLVFGCNSSPPHGNRFFGFGRGVRWDHCRRSRLGKELLLAFARELGNVGPSHVRSLTLEGLRATDLKAFLRLQRREFSQG